MIYEIFFYSIHSIPETRTMVINRDFCAVCNKAVENLLKPPIPVGNCLDKNISRKILSVAKFERTAQEWEKKLVVPPRTRGKHHGNSPLTVKRNAKEASEILLRWVKKGVSNHVQRYIHFHEPELERFLEFHHDLTLTVPSAQNHHRSGSSDYHLETPDDDRDSSWVDNPTSESEDSSSDATSETTEDSEVGEDSSSEEEDCSSFRGPHYDLVGDMQRADRDASGKKYTLRYVLELFKAMKSISDAKMTFLLGLFKKFRPSMTEEDFDSLPEDGRSMCRPANKLLKSVKLRRIRCGLGVDDGKKIIHVGQEPKYTSDNEDVYQSSSDECAAGDGEPESSEHSSDEDPLFQPQPGTAKGPSKPKKKKKAEPPHIMGDMADFSIEENIFLESAGNTNGKIHRAMLLRAHAAKPMLLSKKLLEVADQKACYALSQVESTNRPKMNHFALKVHVDGVQIAKNSVKPQAIPILASIDRIDAFDDDAENLEDKIKKEGGVILPVRYAQPFILGLYHGVKKPDLYDFFQHVMDELDILDPFITNAESLQVAKSKGLDRRPRRIVVTVRTACCDSPMRSWLGGELFFFSYLLLYP